MAAHDPRSRDLPNPTSPGGDDRREPTQSLSVDPDEHDAPAPLARGTRAGTHRPVTRIESPGARPRPPALRADDPTAYLGAVLGSYRVIELLGKGGMGYVFRADHVKLGREVALKLLRSDYASRRDAVARFFQEARTVNRVRHRNIVDVTDLVELDDGTTYIVMELLTGMSLGAWAGTGVDLPRALAVLVQICDGLAAAHQVGVVHRDLKPDNVIVVPTSDGAELVKLLDFGVAKLLGLGDEDVGFQTAAGSVIGTPAYMSPEQAGGMVIDARSDIYSLGAIMYELFCGQPVFRGRSFGEYVRKHLTELPVPPRQTPGGAAIDPQLEALIVRCLDKDPELRFSHITELREALLHMLGGRATLPDLLDPGPPRDALAGTQLPASGLRSQVLPLPVTPPGGPRPTPPAQRSEISGPSVLSGSHAWQPPFRAPGDRPPRPALVSAAPWWVWFGAGAATVGIGIAAAIWVGGRAESDLAPRPAPARALPAPATPADRPIDRPIDPPTPRVRLLEVRFDSAPSGSVFAEGRPTELCRTPCAFDIDRSDGGPADRRTFVVRRAGYVDGSITVDLTGAQREFQVALQRLPTEPAATGADEARSHAGRAGGNAPPADRRPGKRPAKPPRRGGKDATSHVAREAGDPNDAGRDRPGEPAESTPTVTRPPAAPPGAPAIDPADTLDPFQRKK